MGNRVIIFSQIWRLCMVVVLKGNSMLISYLSTLIDLMWYWKWIDLVPSIYSRKKSVIFKILDHLEFEFIGVNNIVDPAEFRALPMDEILAYSNVVLAESPMLSEFMDVFKDFLVLSLGSTVEFANELILRTRQIFYALYRPRKLEKVKDQWKVCFYHTTSTFDSEKGWR